jgi:hypothetical protein
MSARHQYMSLHEISAGMVLADNLLDKLGHILLPAGVCLSESMLKSIQNHQIHQLSILIDDPSGEVQNDAEEGQKKRDRLEYLFRQDPNDAPSNTLLIYLRQYRSGDTDDSHPAE